MQLLITGITGLIGKHLAYRALEDKSFSIKGHCFSARDIDFFTSRGIPMVRADINDPEAIRDICSGCDIVVHAAARVIDFGTREEFYATHYHATRYLLEDALKHGVKHFVYISSIGASSGIDRKKGIPDESFPLLRTGILYDDVKIDTEKLVQDVCREHQMDYTIVRPSAVVGPESVWVREPIERILKNGFFPLIDKGRHSACLVDARNLADGIYRIITLPVARNQIYFFTDDFMEITWKQYFTDLLAMIGRKPGFSIPFRVGYPVAVLMEKIANISGKKPLIAKKSLCALGTDRRVSTKKAQEELGWQSKWTYPETMQNIEEWVKKEYAVK